MNTLTTKQGIGTKVQLCTMMFMQYMLSAVWWVPLAAYLSHTLKLEVYQVSLVLSAMAIGAMASSFIGAIADRYFAAEKILAVLNILTGAFLLLGCPADIICSSYGMCRAGHALPYADTEPDQYDRHEPYAFGTVSAYPYVRFGRMGSFRYLQRDRPSCDAFIRFR